MKGKVQTRFDIDALRDIAGEKVFARGQDYYRDGMVEILSSSQKRIVAQVAGTDQYRTVITGQGKRIDGECSCPAAEQWAFCKHMVAVALAANASKTNIKVDGESTLDRIHRDLKSKSIESLVEMIVKLAERDASLFRKLDIASLSAQADDKIVESNLRKAIDTVTRTRGYVDYDGAKDWAAGVGDALDAIESLLASGRGGVVLKLADHALDKIENAMDGIDDSDGYCGGLLSRVAALHLAACKQARPNSVKLAVELFEREMSDVFDIFHGSAETYAEVLGDEGLAAYRQTVVAAWQKLPPRNRRRGEKPDYDPAFDTLKRMLDFFLERDGDSVMRIALREKDLSSQWKYLELAEFLLSQGQEEDALKRAEEGLWLFEDDRTDQRLLNFAVTLLVKQKRKDKAEALLWSAFAKSPSFDLYRRLKQIGGVSAVQRVIVFLDVRMTKVHPGHWAHPSTLLIEILSAEKMFDQAWQVVKKTCASAECALALALASEVNHPAGALEVYAKRVESLVGIGARYDEAAQLVKRMARLRSLAEQAAYVNDLKTRYAHKRNLLKLLQ